MTTTAFSLAFALVLAMLLILYNLRRFDTIKTQPLTQPDHAKKDDLTQNHWVITSVGDIVVLTAGESHDIIEYGFIWDLLNDAAEQAQTSKTLFSASQLIIDFSQLKYIGHSSCEFHAFSKKYAEAKGKPIIFVGIGRQLREIFSLLQCADLAPDLLEFSTLAEAMIYCRSEPK